MNEFYRCEIIKMKKVIIYHINMSICYFWGRNPYINKKKEKRKHLPTLGIVSNQRGDIFKSILARFQT